MQAFKTIYCNTEVVGVWYFYSIDNGAMNARVFDFYHIHLHILQVLFVCDDVLGILLQSLLHLEEWKVCSKISVTFRGLGVLPLSIATHKFC